jgi:hypothetical protein
MQPPELVIDIIEELDVPAGTSVVISESLIIVNEASIPSNVTDVASLKKFPVIVIRVFSGPLIGKKDVNIGAGHKLMSSTLFIGFSKLLKAILTLRNRIEKINVASRVRFFIYKNWMAKIVIFNEFHVMKRLLKLTKKFEFYSIDLTFNYVL